MVLWDVSSFVCGVSTLLVLLVGVNAQDCTVDGRCDTHPRCSVWAFELGECLKNKEYMRKHCPASCANFEEPVDTGGCVDLHARCPKWAELGECYENPDVMKRYCRASCDACDDETTEPAASDDDDPLCLDSHENCAFWASHGECDANPNYMRTNCAKSCGTCARDISADSKALLKATVKFGEEQVAQGSDAAKTLEVIQETIRYMQSSEFTNLSKDIQDKCLNRNSLCSFWVAIGECEANPAFMITNCAPSCHSCAMIDLDTRCPPLENAVPALTPGSLNNMFDRIVKTAPGNRTLTDVERKELSDDQMPEYTVMVHSGPLDEFREDELSEYEDKRLPPWVITFDEFLTAEECQALINAGYEEGYERSKDVGKENFDGSFDGAESKGRTSENAWCSAKGGCRDKPVIQRVMQRMSKVMDIPPENSEDLQLLRYEKGQFYNAHHDYIPHQRDRHCGPRILTFFLYLSDVEAGGGTDFPNLGITIMPKRGRAVLWPSVLNSAPLKADYRTRHAALPVEAGTKFAANGWIHTYDYLTPQAKGCN